MTEPNTWSAAMPVWALRLILVCVGAVASLSMVPIALYISLDPDPAVNIVVHNQSSQSITAELGEGALRPVAPSDDLDLANGGGANQRLNIEGVGAESMSFEIRFGADRWGAHFAIEIDDLPPSPSPSHGVAR